MKSKIAVTIPCYNEAPTIVKVINDFKQELPDAEIIVIDNNSTDGSDALAKEAGARVLYEKRQGKGFVVASIMRKIQADYYVMVDGDDTYPAEYIHQLLQPLYDEKADMVVGRRLESFDNRAFRPMHIFGNKMVCGLINLIFKTKLTDPMSGYRAFTDEIAAELPIVAIGFDIETEMTMQLLYRRFVIHEVDIHYRERPENSPSKLNTFRDGYRVLLKILKLLVAYKPLTFFGSIALAVFAAALVIGYFPIREYIEFQYVFSVPKAVLASSLVIVGMVLLTIGSIVTITNYRLLEISSILSVRQDYFKRGNQNRRHG